MVAAGRFHGLVLIPSSKVQEDVRAVLEESLPPNLLVIIVVGSINLCHIGVERDGLSEVSRCLPPLS